MYTWQHPDKCANSRRRAEEVVAPYYVFCKAGYDVTIASIKGGEIPVDEASLQGPAQRPKRFVSIMKSI